MKRNPPTSTYLEWIKQNMKKYYVKEMDLICENWEKNIPKKIVDIKPPNKKDFIDFSQLKNNII
jgi:sulfur transfer complex TusBCD TusB component (DsrH family)